MRTIQITFLSAVPERAIAVLSVAASALVGACGGDEPRTTESSDDPAGAAASGDQQSPPPSPTSPPDDPLPDRSTVPVIVAQGYMGRTTISCDDGLTWIAERSFDQEGHEMICKDASPVRCGDTPCTKMWTDGSCYVDAPCDCAHASGYPKGVAVAQQQILSNFGWGNPPVVMRSLDGVDWDGTYHPPGGTPNLVFGADRFIRFDSVPTLSDDGVTWHDGGFADFNSPGEAWRSPRAFEFLDFMAGRFIGAIDGNGIRVSADRGESWTTPTSIPDGCTQGVGYAERFLTGNGIAVFITNDRKACRSVDGGETWTIHEITTSQTGMFFQHGVFAHGRFMTWGLLDGLENDGVRFSSEDGATWTETPTNGPIWLGAVGVTETETLVATNGSDYENQFFFRSTDEGLTWTALDTSAFVQGHAILRFGAGRIQDGGVCGD